jgi:hypothetical protein
MKFRQYTNYLPFDGRLHATARQIEDETMFFNFTSKDDIKPYSLARKFIAELTANKRLDELLRTAPWSLDTRSHMLMRGWYPAIPGWHHDDVDRGFDGQPDYTSGINLPNPEREMYAVVVDALDAPTGSLTEFVCRGENVSVPWPVPTDAPIYRYWNQAIESEDDSETFRVESGRIVAFDQHSFHRAVPAESTGWRWFARLTFNPGPRSGGPKIRRQSQVYLPATNSGW